MAKADTGYSGTPLIRKLGIKPGLKLLLLHAPGDYFDWLEDDVREQICKTGEKPDWMHVFAANSTALEKGMKQIVKAAQQNKQLIAWVSWYKKSAGIPTDITEDTIRDMALAAGMVDVKVCAINAQWSALKLVVPLAKRT